MKNILIISYSYPPSNAPAAQRPYAFAKHLDKTKYKVTVLTCENQDSSLGFNSNNSVELPQVDMIKVKSYNISSFRDVKKSSMQNVNASMTGKIKSLIYSVFSGFIFPDKGIFWFIYLVPFVFKNKDSLKSDIIFSTSPLFSNHLVGRLVKIINPRAKYISDFRDYHYLENSIESSVRNFLNSRLEKKVINGSDRVLFISDGMKDVYSNFYKKMSSKFRTIYNGFDIDDFDDIVPAVTQDKLKIFYAGSFYRGLRSPKPLLLTLENLLEKNLIDKNEFFIEIAGNFEKELADEISNLKVFKNIIFLGLLPREQVLKKYIDSHVLWLIVGNKVTHYSGVPIKMYEYMGARRPIINFAPDNSEPTKIIANLDIGWNLTNDENNIDKKSKVVLDIFSKYRNGELNTQLESKLSDKYLRINQTKQLEKIIEQLYD